MINLKHILKKDATYIIGVSGGPDSMALFDMCYKQKITIVVAHMNYQKRDTALRDEQIVIEECLKYGIPYAIRKQNKECSGNFQAFARMERYAFYEELINEYQAEGVLLAHHLDDHLETYIMQKERKSIPMYYGIARDANVLNCHVIRPLLHVTKQELLEYCVHEQVPYGVDESNLTDDYTRNRIRHTMIEHMSRYEKEELASRIEEENKEQAIKNEKISTFMNNWHQEIKSLQEVDDALCSQILFYWIRKEMGYTCTHEECLLLAKLVKQSNQWTRVLANRYIVYNEYGFVQWMDEREDVAYEYTLKEVVYLSLPYCQICKEGSVIEGVSVSKEDFPLTIRNVKEGDTIHLRLGHKKVHRWFIDRKIPRKERKKWPVLVNAVGNVIFVPGIGCDIAHFSNNPNIFVVK